MVTWLFDLLTEKDHLFHRCHNLVDVVVFITHSLVSIPNIFSRLKQRQKSIRHFGNTKEREKESAHKYSGKNHHAATGRVGLKSTRQAGRKEKITKSLSNMYVWLKWGLFVKRTVYCKTMRISFPAILH